MGDLLLVEDAQATEAKWPCIESQTVTVYDPSPSEMSTVRTKSSVVIFRATSPVPNKEFMKKLANFSILKSFENLKYGWNGYGALPIPSSLISKVVEIIDNLPIQPFEIFPTGRESIQLEYDVHKNSLEIEIQAHNIRFLLARGENIEEWNATDSQNINNAIAKFYASIADS